MSDIMQDKYILGQSQNKSIQNVGEEIRLDLDLTLNDRDVSGTIVEGFIIDEDGNPIKDALVKLMSVEFNPLMHSLSNEDGEYIINDITPEKMYRIYAIAKGKKLKKGNIFFARPYQKVKINFILEDDPAMALGIIAGDVKDLTTNNNLDGAVISLFNVDDGNRETLKSVVYTNNFGQFVFREVPIGEYIIRSTSLGYNVNEVSISIGASGQISSTDIFLSQSANNKSKGTVSGLIKDPNGNPVDGADVILYLVNGDNSLTPTAFTKTDATGVYLFNNVPQGTYKIKSTETKIVKVNVPISPNFDSFTIATIGTLIPLEFTATEGSLFNNAYVLLNNSYVGNIGGNNHGYVVVSTIVPFPGIYNLNIQYLCGDKDRPLNVKINDIDIGNTLNCPKTNGWTENDEKWINTDINLDQGINFIEFYVNSDLAAPWVGKYTIKFKPQSVTKNATQGTLENGSNVTQGSFVDHIGGPTNGLLTITINVPTYGSHILYIWYISGNGERPLKVDLNGNFVGEYLVPPSGDWSPANAKYYPVPLDLNPGDNTFRFYNTSDSYAPVIGDLTVSQPNVNQVYQAENSLLFNGAKAENGLVTGIGRDAGYLIFNADIPLRDSYDFIIKYASTEDTVCNIEVDDVSTEETYIFPPTGSNNNPTGTLSTKLYLDRGKNAIKVYNE